MTSEGWELQEGLRLAGWTLAGVGYGDHCNDVPTLLDRFKPTHVFVQDKRDWDPNNDGAYDKTLGFTNIEALANYSGHVSAPVKDAGSVVDYQKQFIEQIRPDAVVVYYHPQSVLPLSRFLEGHTLVRTYHSIDREVVDAVNLKLNRRRAVVSGATNRRVYPLRSLAFMAHGQLDIDRIFHPGYGNGGRRTPDYLRQLSEYKVHLATASKYGFALRKIIESVAVGCTPVTDLPAYDVLPEIDGALVRVDHNCGLTGLRAAIDRALDLWNFEERMEWARKAWAYYDWRIMGQRLSENLCLTKLRGRKQLEVA